MSKVSYDNTGSYRKQSSSSYRSDRSSYTNREMQIDPRQYSDSPYRSSSKYKDFDEVVIKDDQYRTSSRRDSRTSRDRRESESRENRGYRSSEREKYPPSRNQTFTDEHVHLIQPNRGRTSRTPSSLGGDSVRTDVSKIPMGLEVLQNVDTFVIRQKAGFEGKRIYQSCENRILYFLCRYGGCANNFKRDLKWKHTDQGTSSNDDDDEENQDAETEDDRLQDGVEEDQEQNRDPVKDDFVAVYLTYQTGQTKEFVAQILDIDNGLQLAQLQFMKKVEEKGLFYWPTADDVSWESFAQILVILDKPVLCDALSTNRRQLFKFSSKLLEKSSNIMKFL